MVLEHLDFLNTLDGHLHWLSKAISPGHANCPRNDRLLNALLRQLYLWLSGPHVLVRRSADEAGRRRVLHYLSDRFDAHGLSSAVPQRTAGS